MDKNRLKVGDRVSIIHIAEGHVTRTGTIASVGNTGVAVILDHAGSGFYFFRNHELEKIAGCPCGCEDGRKT